MITIDNDFDNMTYSHMSEAYSNFQYTNKVTIEDNEIVLVAGLWLIIKSCMNTCEEKGVKPLKYND